MERASERSLGGHINFKQLSGNPKVTCLIPATANVQLGLQECKINKSLTVTVWANTCHVRLTVMVLSSYYFHYEIFSYCFLSHLSYLIFAGDLSV